MSLLLQLLVASPQTAPTGRVHRCEDEDDEEKECSKCHETKPLDDFRFRKDLRSYVACCKKCENKRPHKNKRKSA